MYTKLITLISKREYSITKMETDATYFLHGVNEWIPINKISIVY